MLSFEEWQLYVEWGIMKWAQRKEKTTYIFLFVCLRNSNVLIPWKKSLKIRQWNFCSSVSCLEMISQTSVLAWNHHVAEISRGLLVPLCPPPACWDYRGVTDMADGKRLPSLIYCWKLLYNNFISSFLFLPSNVLIYGSMFFFSN